MQTTKIFLVDIGSEFYKLGFAREDCSILEKTPSGIFDDQKRLIDSEKYAKIIVEHLNTLVVPNDNQQNIQNQIVDQPVNQLQNHQMYINLVIAHNNNCHILNHLFHACKYLKGVLFVNPAVMDCYATGRTTGLVINLSSNWLHGAIIIESKVIYEDSIRIRTDQNNVIENECSEKIQVTQNHEKGSKPKEQKNKDLKLKEEEDHENKDLKPKEEEDHENKDLKPIEEEVHENKDLKPKEEEAHENKDLKPKEEEVNENKDLKPKEEEIHKKGTKREKEQKNKEEIHENKEQQVKQTTIASTKHESQVDTKSKDEQSTVLLVNFFDKIFSNAKQETRNLLLQNVILCGGSVTSDMVITLNNHLSKYNNVKIILDHTIFSTFTGMDILAINLKGFITRKEWEEFGDKSIEKFGIEWYK